MDNQDNANYPINPMQNPYFNSPFKNSSPHKMPPQGKDDKFPSQATPHRLNIIDFGYTPSKKMMDYNGGFCLSLGQTPLMDFQMSPVMNHQMPDGSLQKSQNQNRGQIYGDRKSVV